MGAPPPDPAAAERLSAAARRLVDLVRRSAADDEAAERACAAIESACEALEPTAVGGPWHQRGLVFAGFGAETAASAPPRDFAAFFPYSPLVGPRNPLAPPAELEVREGRIHGRVRLGPAYNGPPGCVHGGVIASIFDELLGCVNVANGVGGMTGTLRVVYRAPTPLETELSLEAWVDRTEGRKVFTRGTLRHGDTLCAEAEGIFVQGSVQKHAEKLVGVSPGD